LLLTALLTLLLLLTALLLTLQLLLSNSEANKRKKPLDVSSAALLFDTWEPT
jgi:hypothetical protein